jgi:hypothetical protein
MNAPGKGLLKTVSILYIIFGAIATVIALLGLVGSAALTAWGAAGYAVGGVLMAALILMLVVSVLELILGIVGLNRSGDPEKANYFITTGIILGILALIPMIISGVAGGLWTNLVGFVLAVLYVVGGSMNKRTVTQR